MFNTRYSNVYVNHNFKEIKLFCTKSLQNSLQLEPAYRKHFTVQNFHAEFLVTESVSYFIG